MKPVRIAVIGTGLIGTEHLRFIEELRSTELVGIADVSAAGAAHADRLRVPYFNDFQTMLEAIRPEAAIVALPNALHVPAALNCVGLVDCNNHL